MVEAYSDLTKKSGGAEPTRPRPYSSFSYQAVRWTCRSARRSLRSRSQSEKRSM
jgi:hypothetical protein